MLFPISDDDRSLKKTAPVTIILILINLAVFFLLQQPSENDMFTYGWSVIPYEIANGVDLVGSETIVIEGQRQQVPQAPGPTPIYLTIFSAMFMHGGYMHLFGNLLYLWIFGDNVELRFGAIPFIGFYLLSGIVATFAQVYLDPSGVIPNLGASGAISGVLGAYMILFPRNRVHAIFLWTIVSIPAIVAIGAWIVMQFVSGWGSLFTTGNSAGGVAYAAHIGGFFAGVILAFIMRVFIKEEPEDPFEQYAGFKRSKRIW